MSNNEQPPFLDLKKALVESFELNLKKADILQIPTLDTKLAVDRSTSMREEFDSGWVDRTIDLFLVAAMKFDDDGELELGFYNNSFQSAPNLKPKDIGTKVTKALGVKANGGTNFTPVLEAMVPKDGVASKLSSVFAKLRGKEVFRNYLGWITDGDAYDLSEFEYRLESVKDTFIQIVAIGNQVTLGPLRNLEKRHPFLSVIHFPDPHRVSHDQFYEALCNPKFKAWIESNG